MGKGLDDNATLEGRSAGWQCILLQVLKLMSCWNALKVDVVKSTCHMKGAEAHMLCQWPFTLNRPRFLRRAEEGQAEVNGWEVLAPLTPFSLEHRRW
jgi:hypothetical protein